MCIEYVLKMADKKHWPLNVHWSGWWICTEEVQVNSLQFAAIVVKTRKTPALQSYFSGDFRSWLCWTVGSFASWDVCTRIHFCWLFAVGIYWLKLNSYIDYSLVSENDTHESLRYVANSSLFLCWFLLVEAILGWNISTFELVYYSL